MVARQAHILKVVGSNLTSANMEIEEAKKLIGRTARFGQLTGEITDIRKLEEGMILVYFAGTVMNLKIVYVQDPETKNWETF